LRSKGGESLFNEDLESKNYFIPGLVAVIISIIGFSSQDRSLSGNGRKDDGIAHLHSCPKGELIIGKLFPYFLLGLLDLVLAVLMGKGIFQVPLRGSITLLFPPLIDLCPRCPGAWIIHLHRVRHPASGNQMAMVIGFLRRSSCRGSRSAFTTCPLAPGHHLWHCAPILRDHREGDFSEGSDFSFLWRETLVLAGWRWPDSWWRPGPSRKN